MTSPIQSPREEYRYGEYIKRIKELTLKASTDILDFEADHREDTFLFGIYFEELQIFKSSLYNIKRKTSAYGIWQRVSRICHKFVSSCFMALFDIVLVVVKESKTKRVE